MPTLIACLTTGKGTWNEVFQVIKSQSWKKVFLITNEFGMNNLTEKKDNIELIHINTFSDASTLSREIKNNLTGKISDFEVALNFASGSGKEHMALLEAVMELGLNFRLVTLKNNQVEIMGLEK